MLAAIRAAVAANHKRNATKDLIDALVLGGVMTKRKLWSSLEKHKEYLLSPVDFEKELLARAPQCWSQNQYLVNLMTAANQYYIPPFKKGKEAQDTIVYEAMVEAIFLERLTSIVLKDKEVLYQSLDIWPHLVKEEHSTDYKKFHAFGRAKYFSVQYVLQGCVDAFKKNHIGKTNGALTIPINILEAVFEDLVHKNTKNAKTGAYLAWYNPGRWKNNTLTGAGPTTVDGTKIAYRYPLPKLWSDLYTVWNLDFVVTEFEDWVEFPPKLLIPAVSCYQEEPHHYIYGRGVALWIFINYNMLKNYEHHAAGNSLYNWNIRNISIDLAKVNLESATHYVKTLAATDNSLGEKIKDEISSAFNDIKKKTHTFYKAARSGLEKVKNQLSGVFGRLFGKIDKRVDEKKKKHWVP